MFVWLLVCSLVRSNVQILSITKSTDESKHSNWLIELSVRFLLRKSYGWLHDMSVSEHIRIGGLHQAVSTRTTTATSISLVARTEVKIYDEFGLRTRENGLEAPQISQPNPATTAPPLFYLTFLSTASQPNSMPLSENENEHSTESTKGLAALYTTQSDTLGTKLEAALPSSAPSSTPRKSPTRPPTRLPAPTTALLPTIQSTFQPTQRTSARPRVRPTAQPTPQPTPSHYQPSSQPTGQPTGQPTARPSTQPTAQPTGQPTSQPTAQPAGQPSTHPFYWNSQINKFPPTLKPSMRPSIKPSISPTQKTFEPTQKTSSPSIIRSPSPSLSPTFEPSITNSFLSPSNGIIVTSQQPSGIIIRANSVRTDTSTESMSVTTRSAIGVVVGFCFICLLAFIIRR